MPQFDRTVRLVALSISGYCINTPHSLDAALGGLYSMFQASLPELPLDTWDSSSPSPYLQAKIKVECQIMDESLNPAINKGTFIWNASTGSFGSFRGLNITP